MIGHIVPPLKGRAVALLGSASLICVLTVGSLVHIAHTFMRHSFSAAPFLITNIFCLIYATILAGVLACIRGHCTICRRWTVDFVRVEGVQGSFKGGAVLRNIGVSLRGKGMVSVVKPSNTKGDALLQYLGRLRLVRNNSVYIRKRCLTRRGSNEIICTSSIATEEVLLHVNVMFRSFGLFPRVAILSGVLTTPICIGKVGQRSMVPATSTLLSGIKLLGGGSICPNDLSNKRGRHMTVTQTLTVGPSVVLFSRPASTLSPRLAKRILGAVRRLTSRGVAVTVIARRVTFTGSISSGILFVMSKGIRRRKADARVFRGPRDREAHSFLRSVLEWG